MFYDKMKSKWAKLADNNANFINLENVPLSMFDYKNLPDTLPKEFVEGYLISNGHVGFKKFKGDVYCCAGSYSGEIKGYLPTRYVGVVVNVGSLDDEIGKTVVVGWNNATMSPDIDILRYSDILTEIDVSERLNVLFARLLRIPKASDQKEKIAIEKAIEDILKGKITAITGTNIQEIIGGDTNNKFLDLADVKNIDKLQYLNQYRENVVKRFYSNYGMPMRVTDKLAQQSEDEVHGNDSVSFIMPLQKLYYRRKMVDELNEMFGLNVEVGFTELWKNVYDGIVNYEVDEPNESEVMEDVNKHEDGDNVDSNPNNPNTESV